MKILGLALFASVTSFVVAYNSILTAVVVTCSAVLAIKKVYDTFSAKSKAKKVEDQKSK